MKKLIVFNWKMNPKTIRETAVLSVAVVDGAVNLKKSEVVIAPPVVYLAPAADFLREEKSKVKLAMQNAHWEAEGAYTGEISPVMGKGLGAGYVILGHSERRALGETDEMISKKVEAALTSGLKVILCVGEPFATRKKGIGEVKKFIKSQISKDLGSFENRKSEIGNIVVAYEPIWAIGTGKSASPEDAVEVVNYIKELLVISYKLQVNVLYGGSVNSSNLNDFISRPEIDGALIGGASVNKKELTAILEKLK